MKSSILIMLALAGLIPVAFNQVMTTGIRPAAVSQAQAHLDAVQAAALAAPAAPAATPSGAWMWQEQGSNPLDAGSYAGDYVRGKSMSLTPYSSNGGSVAKAAQNMAGVTALTPVTGITSGVLTGTSALSRGTYRQAQ